MWRKSSSQSNFRRFFTSTTDSREQCTLSLSKRSNYSAKGTLSRSTFEGEHILNVTYFLLLSLCVNDDRNGKRSDCTSSSYGLLL